MTKKIFISKVESYFKRFPHLTPPIFQYSGKDKTMYVRNFVYNIAHEALISKYTDTFNVVFVN